MATAALSLLLLLVVVIAFGAEAAAKRKIPNWHIRAGEKQGANACVVEEIPGKDWKLWTECRYHKNREICGQKTRLRYECCGGFHQMTGQPGCPGVNPMVDVLQTAKHYGAAKFVELVEQAGLAERFKRQGPFTLFAPIDKAFERLSNDKKVSLVPKTRGKNSTVLLHAIDHTVHMDDVDADTVLPSLYGLDLRVNKYNNGMKTVNCILIVRKDLQASNGVVHLVEKILEPYAVVPGKNLAEMIEQDGRFSQLANALKGSKCNKKLQNAHQSYTVLAPSDEAFQKLPQGKLERLLSNPETKEALLDNHVIPHPTCLSAVTGKAKQKTLGKEKLELDCDGRGVSVAGQRLRNSYQIGTNGLLYMVDDLILPQKTMGAMQLVENEKLVTFTEIVRKSGMAETLESMPNLTIFAPSEAAMYTLPKEELQLLKDDRDKARQFVMQHTVEGSFNADSMSSDKSLRSLDRRDNLRVQVELNALGVEGAKLEKRDIKGSSTCMHVINKTLRPATESAEAVLRTMGNFTFFVKGLSQALKSPTLSQSRGQSVTIIAPTDKAFRELPEEKLQQYTTDRKFMNKVLRGHVADHMVSFSMLKSGLKYLVDTKYSPVYFSMDRQGTKSIGDAEVVQADIIVKEGVVHIVDTVLMNGNNGHKK